MDPIFFSTPVEFRQWLIENHDSLDVQWIGYYKKASGIPSMTWPESVDEALCFGWIDGLRKSIDDVSYKIRFTPRRPNSMWSAVNLKRVPELISLGLMEPAGLAAYAKRDDNGSNLSAYERANPVMDEAYLDKIRQNPKAWAFYENLAPSYKKSSIHWVMSAKQEATRLRRLGIVIESSAEGKKVPFLRGKKGK